MLFSMVSVKMKAAMPTGSLSTQLIESKSEHASELSEWHANLRDDLTAELFYNQPANLSMN